MNTCITQLEQCKDNSGYGVLSLRDDVILLRRLSNVMLSLIDWALAQNISCNDGIIDVIYTPKGTDFAVNHAYIDLR